MVAPPACRRGGAARCGGTRLVKVPVRSVYVYACVCVCMHACMHACVRVRVRVRVRCRCVRLNARISFSDIASPECRDKKMSALRQPTNKVATCHKNNARTHTRAHTHTHTRGSADQADALSHAGSVAGGCGRRGRADGGSGRWESDFG